MAWHFQKNFFSSFVAQGTDSQLTMVFNLSLLEHAVMCKIVQGQGSQAVQEVDIDDNSFIHSFISSFCKYDHCYATNQNRIK